MFESYPIRGDGGSGTEVGGLRIVDIEARDSAHYPLSVVASVPDRLRVTVKFRPDLLEEARAAGIAERLMRVLRAFAGEPGCRLRPSTFSPMPSGTNSSRWVPVPGRPRGHSPRYSTPPPPGTRKPSRSSATAGR
ncbi:hypothetical protein P9209_06335 [Prescottella defluvii]|nr:hypothetical protein P9209_06335 [Prescottella defluvii]